MSKVSFFRVTQAQYEQLSTKNQNAIYFLTDKGIIYMGGKAYGQKPSALPYIPAGTFPISEPNKIVLPSSIVPVAVQINNKLYSISQTGITTESNFIYIDCFPLAVKANVDIATRNTWKVYRALTQFS